MITCILKSPTTGGKRKKAFLRIFSSFLCLLLLSCPVSAGEAAAEGSPREKSFSWSLTGPEHVKVVRAGQKACIRWDKVRRASSYRLQYSTDPSFPKGKTRTVYVKGKTIKKLKKLNKKKTYYFRVQASRRAGSKVYRTGWSEPEQVQTFTAEKIPEEVFRRMKGKSYPEEETGVKIRRSKLRYLTLYYVDFEGKQQQGEMVCHRKIAGDLVDIFYELYLKEYPIESIRLIDDFDADDERSMEADNTSCFCYRLIGGTDRLSNHGLGLAVDLNPLYNPQVFTDEYGIYSYPYGSEPYADRSREFPHKISKKDAAYKLFIRHGFIWGGTWDGKNDYMHFEIKNDTGGY